MFTEIVQRSFHCRSCVLCITPSTLHPNIPFLPPGHGIPVSHVLSVRLQAPLRPSQLSFPSSRSPHSTPLDSFFGAPQSSVPAPPPPPLLTVLSGPILDVSKPPLSETLFMIVMLNCLFCSVCLISNLFFSFSLRCKEGYHGLRCDQFVPKTDAILSDRSKRSVLTFIPEVLEYVCAP